MAHLIVDLRWRARRDAGEEELVVSVTLYVCTTCRPLGLDPDAANIDEPATRPGRRLLDALTKLQQHPANGAHANDDNTPALKIEPVECLSVCKRPATIAVSGPGRWTYIYGNLDPDTAAAEILNGVKAYAATIDGIVPWRERPDIFKRGVVARIPPRDAIDKNASNK